MNNTFNKTYNAGKLFRFALPSMIMMMFFSMYTIIDGLFVSNFVNTTALGALNIVYPVIALCSGISIMIASGGGAMIAKRMGEGKNIEAKRLFSFLVFIEIIIALAISIIGNLFINQIVSILGATDSQFLLAKEYLQIILWFLPFASLQNAFQIFFATAGKPKLGLFVILGAGFMNIFLDYIFIVVLNLGVSGAALGTVLSYLIPSFTGLIYFSIKRNDLLCFVPFKFYGKDLGECCINGSSEMLTSIATAITTFIFNYQCLKYYGEDGVAAISVVSYFQFLISAVYFGFSQGTAPVISYQYGSQNFIQLKKVLKYCIIDILLFSVVAIILSFALISPVASLFAGSNTNVYNIIMDGFIWFAFGLMLMGISIFASSFFTALGDGVSSSIISGFRTLIFLTLALIIVPLIMGELGIWFAVTLAEVLGVILSTIYLVTKRKKYHY